MHFAASEFATRLSAPAEVGAPAGGAAEAVLASAAEWAKKHPKLPVVIASYADPYGSETTNVEFVRLRAEAVANELTANGVEASRIQRQNVGPVKFESEPQESRRVVVTVGNP